MGPVSRINQHTENVNNCVGPQEHSNIEPFKFLPTEFAADIADDNEQVIRHTAHKNKCREQMNQKQNFVKVFQKNHNIRPRLSGQGVISGGQIL